MDPATDDRACSDGDDSRRGVVGGWPVAAYVKRFTEGAPMKGRIARTSISMLEAVQRIDALAIDEE